MNSHKLSAERTIIMGAYSHEDHHATAGDFMSLEIVKQWLEELSIEYDVALCRLFEGGTNWREVAAENYGCLIYICGPFADYSLSREVLTRFSRCHKVGVNLSMLNPLEQFNPFDLLLERDSTRTTRPDVSFAYPTADVTVAGLVLVQEQREYGSKGMHEAARKAFERVANELDIAIVSVDTRLDINSGGLRTHEQVDAVLARMDIVLTTRLHGLVLALRNGVPAVVIDPISGGAKVARQAGIVAWPCCFLADKVDDNQLKEAILWATTPAARALASKCAKEARASLEEVHDEFVDSLRSSIGANA